MRIVGYNKNDVFVELREASICCTAEELKELRDFFDAVYEDYSSRSAEEFDALVRRGAHSHLRDFSEKWEKTSSDLIVIPAKN